MLKYVYGKDDIIAAAVARWIQPQQLRSFGKCRAIGVVNELGMLIGGIVYNQFDPESGTIEMSCAAVTPRWLSRRTMMVMGGYPFLELGCQMVITRTPATNLSGLRILRACGFACVRLPRLYGRNCDGFICTITDDVWLNNKFTTRVSYEKTRAA